jgi:hypothetical protein
MPDILKLGVSRLLMREYNPGQDTFNGPFIQYGA